MNKVFREEKKFLISVSEYMSKSHLLEQVMLQDKHNWGRIERKKININ